MQEEVRRLCGDGEPLDKFSAASLGLLHYFKDWPTTHTQPALPHSSYIFQEETRPLAEQRHGWSVLMFAAYYRRRDIVEHLVAATLNYQEKDHVSAPHHLVTTPLNLAVLSGDLTSIEILHSLGAVNTQDCKNKTALHWAVETNQPSIATFLLAKGASPDILCNGITSLGVAARQGNITLVELLLKFRAQVCLRESVGSPLTLAMESGNLQVASLILAQVRDKHSFEEILRQVKLEKYWPVFQNRNISYQQFLEMTETDIKNCGIKLLGPRKKIVLLISLLKAI